MNPTCTIHLRTGERFDVAFSPDEFDPRLNSNMAVVEAIRHWAKPDSTVWVTLTNGAAVVFHGTNVSYVEVKGLKGFDNAEDREGGATGS